MNDNKSNNDLTDSSKSEEEINSNEISSDKDISNESDKTEKFSDVNSEENLNEISSDINETESLSDSNSDELNTNNESTDTESIGDVSENSEEDEQITLRKFAAKVKSKILQISIPNCIMRLAGAYLLISAFFGVYHYVFAEESYKAINNWQEYRNSVSLPVIILLTIGIYILLTGLKALCKKSRLDSYLLITGLVAFSLTMLWRCDNFYYAFVAILATVVFGYFGFRYDKGHSTAKLPLWVTIVLIALLTIGSGAFIAVFTIYRYKAYCNSCFDLGLFTQMYHSMINDLSLVTTCERDKFLSHFAIHCSPIYYLLLPFYYFFPSSITLLVAQAVLIASGVVPLVGICRKNKFTNLTTLFFSITYLFCAELIGPCFYEFHENAFLPPLLMWLFYAIESNKKILLYVFTVLVLCVKEDAPIYIVCIGLYLLFRKDKTGMRKHGAIIASIAAVYFVTVTSLMGKFGEGVMTSRTYGNLMIDQDAGFGEIIKTVIMNPSYFLSQLVREENFIFFLTVMVPLGMMPFFTKKFSRLLLLCPFVLMNLASGYYYARDIGFQYVFGTTTCLIYAVIINSADLRPKKRQIISAYVAMASVYMSVAMHSGKVNYRDIYINNQEKYQRQDELLASIPDDASVLCDTFYIPPIANRDEIYMMDDGDLYTPFTTDFVIVRIDTENSQAEINKALSEGYTYYNGYESLMAIYVSPSYNVR